MLNKVKFKDVVKRCHTKEDRFNTDKVYYVGGEHIQPNELKVLERGIIQGSTIGPMFYFGFKAGQILFVTRNPHLHKAALADFDGICSEKTLVLETADSSILLQEYLELIMQSDAFWQYCEIHKSGSINYFINWSTLANFEFNLPSIEEQKSIADKVWAAYELKEAYKKMIAATDEMVKAQFIEMFEGQNYATKPLAQLISKSFPGEWGLEDKTGNGIKVIRTTNITNDGTLDLTETVTRNISDTKLQKKLLKKGDILLERSGGTKDNPVGRVAYFNENDAYVANNFTQTLRSIGDIESYYLFHFLFYYYKMNKMKIRSMGNQTTGIQNLNMDDYMQIAISVPPREHQEIFISIAKQAEKSKSELRQAIEKIDRVMKRLMQ